MNSEWLGPLFVNDQKREDLLITKTWVTKDGDEIKVKAMEVSHLYNAIAFIQPIKHEAYFRKWRRVLNKELRKRMKQYDRK